jgi:hypothetical protein
LFQQRLAPIPAEGGKIGRIAALAPEKQESDTTRMLRAFMSFNVEVNWWALNQVR